jgi:hypothetical protein
MTELAISHALQQRLVTAAIGTVVFENQDANPARPFLFVQHVPTERIDLSLAGGQLISRGFMSVTAVIDEGAFATGAMTLLDQVAAQFPKGLRLPLDGGGVLTIPQPPRILPGFQDLSDYRRVVQVFYDATFDGDAPVSPPFPGDDW